MNNEQDWKVLLLTGVKHEMEMSKMRQRICEKEPGSLLS